MKKKAPASKVNVGSEKAMFTTIGVAENEAGYILLSVQNNYSGKTETYSLLRKDWARLTSETATVPEITWRNHAKGEERDSPSLIIVLNSMKKIVEYNWDDEERDFEENPPDDGISHIFTDLRIVRDFIDTLVVWAEGQS